MRIAKAFQSALLLSLLTSCSPRSGTPIGAPGQVQETSDLAEPRLGVDGTVSVLEDNTVEFNRAARVNLTSAPVGSSLETANYPDVEFMVGSTFQSGPPFGTPFATRLPDAVDGASQTVLARNCCK